jgi:hypothetical protein
MGALGREHEIARRRVVAGRNMQIDAELLADHVLGLANAGDAVEREAGRQRMQGDTAAMQMMRGGGFEHAMDVGGGDLAPADRSLGGEMLRGDAPARGGDDHLVDLHAGHALGGVDRVADGPLGLVHVDDEPVLHAE